MTGCGLRCWALGAALWCATTLALAPDPDKTDWWKDLTDFEIVVPTRVDASGSPYPVDQHYRRKRRSVELSHGQGQGEHPDPVQDSWHEDKPTYYTLEAFGHKFELHLMPYQDFIAPDLQVQHLDVNVTWFSKLNDLGSHCFHQGKVAGDPHSVVALSVCDSLLGTIRAFDQQFLIQPHPENEEETNALTDHPHIIYRPNRIQHYHNDTEMSSNKDNYKHERWKQQDKIKQWLENAANIPHHRQKRSYSRERHVEVMVVADARMAKYHNKDLEHYLLTLMSIVASIYKDPSIGNAVNIVVVKLLVLENERAGPSITANAASTLRNFCIWQQTQNDLDDRSHYHHDTAVLITRQDICRSARKCQTLGLAELGTMCDNYRSCSINEDNGLSAAFTIAHELGHVFNLPHDDNFKCRSFMEHKKMIYHVMSPTLDYQSNPWSWSKCSSNMLTKFLDGGYGECLLDKPQLLKYERRMNNHTQPGQVFDVDKQCALVFGRGSKICPYMPTCKRLWCTSPLGVKTGCRTQHMPWADGTTCAEGKWCQKGECVTKWQRVRRNGGWSKWMPWGKCTRQCGGGIQRSTRLCNNPVPRFGGRYCIGRRVKYRSCNIDDCPPIMKTFREEQCARFDGHHFNINGLPPTVQWIPKFDGIHMKDRCKLFCRVVGGSAYYMLSEKVEDGTKCGIDTTDICVNGQCKRAGCDNRLGSRTKRDKCGVCGGDNSSCRTISGTFNQVRYGYNLVHIIPAGATSIDIRQHGHHNLTEDDNYLSLQNSRNEFILNGNFVVSPRSKKIEVVGATLQYSGSDTTMERINCSRTIQEDVRLMVLSVGDLHPPDIRYMYTISMGEQVNFIWSSQHGPWENCNRRCQGIQKQRVVCVREDDKKIVSDQRCERQKTKPEPLTRSCNTMCTISWRIVDQTECSARCGQGIMIRRFKCIERHREGSKYVDDDICNRELRKKPSIRVACSGLCLPTHWKYGKWSECSMSCGGGVQQRDATCVDVNGHRLKPLECKDETQVAVQSCNDEPCPDWDVGQWTGCSISCGSGSRHREVWCKTGGKVVSNTKCNLEGKPKTKEACDLDPCPVWYEGSWGQCSVTCGEGSRHRMVRCRSVALDVALKDRECNAASRPNEEEQCYLPPCSTTPVYTTSVLPSQARTEWRTGSWTECSATCGKGRKERYVSCRDHEGKIADEAQCSSLPKPASTEDCKEKPCGQWRTGEWTQCTATCGSGVETRYVACIILDELKEQIAENSECEVGNRPTSKRKCNQQSCISTKNHGNSSTDSNRAVRRRHWRTGPWGGCSSTCEGGWQRRRVVCQDQKGLSNKCDKSKQPPDLRPCNSGPCPHWNYGAWGQCTKTCGGGIQNRIVLCQLPNQQTLPDHSCDILERPSSSQRCGMKSCPDHTHWRKGPWSAYYGDRRRRRAGYMLRSGTRPNVMCSVSCGRGHRKRSVTCVDKDGNKVDDELCKSRRRPKTTRRCKNLRCPHWRVESFGECSATCGPAVKQRQVKCVRHLHRVVNPVHCENQTKPLGVESCDLQECINFHWIKKPWASCSQSCGIGKKERQVMCEDLTTNKTVSDDLCDLKVKPKTRRRCNEQPCPLSWIAGDWSQCSVTCGDGHQTRKTTCQAITREGWVLPGEVIGCNQTDHPARIRPCNLGDCNALYHWKPLEWATCSKSCGYGSAKRKVYCVDSRGLKQPRRHCIMANRPSTSKPCYLRPCYASTCKELQQISNIRKDGIYRLLVQGRLLEVYCSGMRRSKPAEYIHLPAGEKENYSEVYGKRLLQPKTCPNNGSRKRDCQCHRHTYPRAGFTSFQRISLNITSLAVITHDFKFSNTPVGRRVPYGTAGDCYSSQSCPQGRFKLNLSGTSLRVADGISWYNYGHKAASRISIKQGGQVVQGTCGGFCGHCAPLITSGLRLQLIP